MNLPKAIICDLDGTLANCEHRVHHVQGKPKNWDAFYAGVRHDKVNEAVRRVLNSMSCSAFEEEWTTLQIIYCSGRPERCREDTERWLKEEARMWFPPETALLMRKEGDYRQDCIVKEELYNAHIKGKYEVLFVLDDRQQVVDMWRANSLTCFQVAPGQF